MTIAGIDGRKDTFSQHVRTGIKNPSLSPLRSHLLRDAYSSGMSDPQRLRVDQGSSLSGPRHALADEAHIFTTAFVIREVILIAPDSMSDNDAFTYFDKLFTFVVRHTFYYLDRL